MPDKRRHRGKHPEDDRLFADSRHEALRTAVAEYSWLLTRGYATDSALKLVGDRHNLTARQRLAVRRSACSDQSLRRRAKTMMAAVRQRRIADQPVAIDGYNLLITIESALSDGIIFIGRDGCYRDLASVHGTYRKVQETVPALEMIVDHLRSGKISSVDWYLDKPVSNSGRLKALIVELVAAKPLEAAGRTLWSVALVNSPDAVLADCPNPVVTSDSVILDRCGTWINLAADIINAHVPQARIVDLRSGGWHGE